MDNARGRLRVAVVDLLLAYPPRGGAGVDLFGNFTRLARRFDVKVFGVSFLSPPPGAPHDFARGVLDSPPPLDCSLVQLAPGDGRDSVAEKVLDEVSRWAPDVVFVADGWTLKPCLALELSKRFKTIVRLYACEMLCPRNNQRWLLDHRCDNNALDDCGRCLDCSREYAEIVRRNRGGLDNPLTFEASLARIWDGGYHETLSRLVSSTPFIVYNSAVGDILRRHGCPRVFTIPGAVDLSEFAPPAGRERTPGVFRILVAGRMDDRAKGADVAVEAGRVLRERGVPVRMTITCQKRRNLDWLDETGWQPQSRIVRMLRESDCALVPSLWAEAFGMTWAEAMAMRVPVVASRIGGPAEYVRDGVTGLLAEPGDPGDFAGKIMEVYNNPALGKSLGDNGRAEVERRFNWDAAARATEAAIESVISGNEDS